MIKIMHVISDSNIGGAGRYLLTYLRNCNRQRFEVSVAVPRQSKLIPEIQALRFPYFEIDGLAERSFSRTAAAALKRIFKQVRPDVVHAHACLSARIAARRCGVRAVFYTRHSVFPQKKLLTSGPGKWLNGLLGGGLADGIIAVADAARQNLLDTGIDDRKIRVIYNGVDGLTPLSEQQAADARAAFNIPADCAVVAMIARLEAVKGHRYFIDAAAKVKQAGCSARFVIAGTGSCEEELRRYVQEQGLEGTVLFTGFIKNVSDLENIMDLQVNASYGTEAASLSLLEGMSLGKPAVVSDFGGNPELIQSGVNGLVAPKQNAQALADGILQVLTDKALYRQLADGSRRIFNSRFTAAAMTKNMEDYYLEVLGGCVYGKDEV